MNKEQQDWVTTTRLWIAGQQNSIAQLQSDIDYNTREIELHQKDIEICKELMAHYQVGVDTTKAKVEKIIKDNSAHE